MGLTEKEGECMICLGLGVILTVKNLVCEYRLMDSQSNLDGGGIRLSLS